MLPEAVCCTHGGAWQWPAALSYETAPPGAAEAAVGAGAPATTFETSGAKALVAKLNCATVAKQARSAKAEQATWNMPATGHAAVQAVHTPSLFQKPVAHAVHAGDCTALRRE